MTNTEDRTALPAGYVTKALATGLKVWNKATGSGYILKSKRGDDESLAGAIQWAWAHVDMIREGEAYWAAVDALAAVEQGAEGAEVG